MRLLESMLFCDEHIADAAERLATFTMVKKLP